MLFINYLDSPRFIKNYQKTTMIFTEKGLLKYGKSEIFENNLFKKLNLL